MRTPTAARGCAEAVPAPAKARKPPINAPASANFFTNPLLIFSSSFMFASKTLFGPSYSHETSALWEVARNSSA